MSDMLVAMRYSLLLMFTVTFLLTAALQ